MTAVVNVLDKVKGWRAYVEAKLGFRNHWYPTLMSSEVAEDKPVTFKLCGENLLINRVDGKVFCVRDRCVHRGVNFSARPECYAKGTLTCWYHGFTYKWDTGDLVRHPDQPGQRADRQAPPADVSRRGTERHHLRLHGRYGAAAARP